MCFLIKTKTIEILLKQMKIKIILISLVSLLFLTKSFAVIPEEAINDSRYSLGYLVVTHYSGVDPTGITDSRAGIQQAIDDAYDNQLVVFFPSGTYLVSDVLKCYSWQLWRLNKDQVQNPAQYHHVLVGSSIGDKPVIRLKPNAAGFDNPSLPRPLLVYRNFVGESSLANSEIEPTNPLTGEPANFVDGTTNLFNGELRNIDFDLSENSGAIGVSFAAAQGSSISNVKIDATNAYAGFFGIPGRNGATANVEVEGGQFGISNKDMNPAGNMIVGAKLYNQTNRAIVIKDFSANSLVGFHIISHSNIAIEQLDSYGSTGGSSLTMVDGKIEMLNGGLAVSNVTGKNLYIENVFIKNATNLVQCGIENPIPGDVLWKQVLQYAYNAQDKPLSGDPPYEAGDKYFNSWSLINGTLSNIPEPILRIENNSPDIDFVEKHIWDELPSWEGENNGTVNILDFGAIPNDGLDDHNAIQTAINFATESGNGFVFIPKGEFNTIKTIELKGNTRFFGASQKTAIINTDKNWSGLADDYTIKTESLDKAVTYLGYLTIYESGEAKNKGSVLWRAGTGSMMKSVETDKPWMSYVPNQVRFMFCFSEKAGGKHYICPWNDMTSYLPDSRLIKITDTYNPLSFYGCNLESSKKPPDGLPGIEVNMEINNSKNVSVHNIKREGNGATVRIHDSENISVYGVGRQKISLIASQRPEGYIQITGDSKNITVAIVETDGCNTTIQKMLKEDLTNQPSCSVDWPEILSIYVRNNNTESTNSKSIKFEDNNLIKAHPNPFSHEVFIDLHIVETGDIQLKVTDLTGKKIWEYEEKNVIPGEKLIIWDGRTNSGSELKSNIYFLNLKTGRYSKSLKLNYQAL